MDPSGFVGQDVRWNVKTRGFVGQDVRWSVKTRGFVDPGVLWRRKLIASGAEAARTNFYLDCLDISSIGLGAPPDARDVLDPPDPQYYF